MFPSVSLMVKVPGAALHHLPAETISKLPAALLEPNAFEIEAADEFAAPALWTRAMGLGVDVGVTYAAWE